ncbi:MAG: choice-of-anchor L domain-containing protein [Flavobacteriales bacterium]
MKQSAFLVCLLGICLLSGLLPNRAFSQLAVDNATNATEAVQTYLLGEGIEATNITFTGNNDQIASFTCTNCNLNIGSGVVMSSGNATTAAGPNNLAGASTLYSALSADADLNAISAVNVYDAAILQFDFVPTGDSLIFSYVFGSDEYPEYINQNFNDAFGFFLSGPGISGPYQNGAINIAQIPGTSLPVSINNLNNGSTGTNGPCEYCQYYIHNGTGTQAPYNGSNLYIQPDGFTVVLQAFAEVICGETYHIKIAIADGGDSSINSWVFLEEGSFESNALDLSFNQPGLSPTDNSMYEGCVGQSILFTRPPNSEGELTFGVEYSGTAINGVDYESLPNEIIIPDGVDSVYVPITAITDALSEGVETIILTVSGGIACVTSVELQLEIYELTPLNVLLPDLIVPCNEDAVLNPTITGGYGNYEVEWIGFGTGDPYTIDISGSTTVEYVVTDICAVESVSGSVDVSIQTYEPITVDAGADMAVSCQDIVSVTPTIAGGNGSYTYQWFVDGQPFSTSQNFTWSEPTSSEVTLEVTDGCGATGDGAFVISIESPAIFVDLGNDIETTCFSPIVITPDVSGGIGEYSYSWEINGIELGTGSTFTTIAVLNNIVTLTVTDDCGGTQSDEVGFVIEADPIAVSLGADLELTCVEVATLDPTVSGGVGNFAYQWTVNGSDMGNGSTLDVAAADNTTVTVSVVDECGGMGSDQITISLADTPLNITTNGNITVTCLSEFTIAPTITGGVGGNEYAWEYNGTSSSGSTLTLSTTEDMVINLSVTDQCGNSDEVIINIVVAASNLNVNITANDTDVCPDENVVLTATVNGSIGSPSYDWNVAGSNSTVNVSSPETESYSITVTDDCNFTATDTYTVEVLEQDFPLTTTNQTVCFGVEAQNIASGGFSPYDYDYSVDSLIKDDDDFLAVYLGYHYITVTDHCGNESTAELFVKPCSIVIPNVFTPEGDGANEFFVIEGIKGFPGSILTVYNRWGNEVFRGENYDNEWNGKDLAEGTYYYVLNRVDGENFGGNITLLRAR